MGRGGGGGGKGGGGGGRTGRAGGGGGGAASETTKPPGGSMADDAAAIDAEMAAAGQIYKESPSQMALAEQNFDTMLRGNVDEMQKLYDDIPPVENANRKIVGDKVVVGDKGAPKVGDTLSAIQANKLLKDRGVPNDVIIRLKEHYGEEGLKGIGELLKTNPQATYINNGYEGLAMNWSESRIIRIQFGVGDPPPSYYVGPVGAYPDWVARYGGVAVEQKERVWDTIKRGSMKGHQNPVFNKIADEIDRRGGGYLAYDGFREATLDKLVRRATGGRIVPGDAHGNNWGVDFKGRLRAVDPGAYIPPGADVTGAGW